MKKYIIAFAVLATVACKNNTEPEMKTAPTQIEETATIEKNETANKGEIEKPVVKKDLNETASQTETTFNSVESGGIFESYLSLKSAFVNTDAQKAQAIATDFGKQLETADKGNDGIQNLRESLATIAGTTAIKEQRSAFESVSRQVESILDNEISDGAIYKQYCPMAFDGKGAYWLSDSKEVRNPYFGDKMLKCGVVDKEIN